MVKIQFETGNSYFEDDEEGHIRAEAVAQVVRAVGIAIADRGSLRESALYSGDIRDDNGNHIGEWMIDA